MKKGDKIYIVTINEVSEFEEFEHEPVAFLNEEDAKNYLNRAKEEAKDDYLDEDDHTMFVDKDTDKYFCIYNQYEGWSHTHYEVQIFETKVN